MRRAGIGVRRFADTVPRALRRSHRRPAKVALVALVGGALGLVLGGSVRHDIGPVKTRLSLRPALDGGTRVNVAPLGAISVNTHDGPLRLVVTVTQLRPDAARRALADPSSLRGLGQQVQRDVRTAVVLLAIRTLLAAVLGAGLLGLLVFRRRLRLALLAAGVAVGGVALAGGVAAITWRPKALAEPHYTGLLAGAPALIGSAEDIVDRLQVYSTQLAGLVTDVTRLYDVTSSLPTYAPDARTRRLLFVSDLHLNPTAWDVVRSVIKQYSIDAVVDTGDLTDHGSRAENRYASPIHSLGVPYVSIRGNHDSASTEAAVRRQKGAVVLDDGVRLVAGLRIFGVGDPRFTPDKTTTDDAASAESLARYGRAAADRLAAAAPVGIAMTHDPVVARQLAGLAPLLLAGHVHRRMDETIDGSLLLVQGSTGGAGLRGLEGERPTPLECSVLYLDRSSHRLLGYDDITLGGLGLTSAQVQRHAVPVPRVGSARTP